MRRLAWTCAALSLLCDGAVASPGLRDLRARERTTYAAKDWRAFLDVEKQLVDAAPVPRHLYGLACAEALNGHADRALDALERAAAFDIALPAAKDDDLVSLRGDPRYEAAVRRIEASRIAQGEIPVARELPRADLIVEDLARDPASHTWYFTSVRKRAVFAWRDGGALRELAKTPWAALGIDFDRRRGVLWVSTASLEEEDGHDKRDEGRTAVLELDARTGELLARHDLAGSGALGDLRLGPDGTAYASDGLNGVVYGVRAGSELTPFVRGLASPQTQAVRGGELIVADYTLGIAAIDLRTRAVRFLSRLPGVDGIAADGDDLYLVANGVAPARVLRLRGHTLETLQRGGDLPDPTHAVVSEGALWVIARSGWEKSGKPPLLKRLQLRTSPIGQETPVPPRPQ